MQTTYQERIGEDGEPLAVPVIPSDATADEIEAIVAAEGATVMTDEQVTELSAHFSEGLSPAGVTR